MREYCSVMTSWRNCSSVASAEMATMFGRGKGYQVLSQLAPLILERQGLGKVTAVLVDKETPRSKVRLGDYTIEARFAERSQDPNAPVAPPVDRVAGLFIQLGPDHYVIVGRSMNVYFESADRKSTRLNSSHLVLSYAVFCL